MGRCKKSSGIGRDSGDCLYGFKKSIQQQYCLKFETFANRVYLSAKLSNTLFKIIPVYLNCNKWLEDFSNLEMYFSRLRTSSFLLIGDFNARISNAQTLDKHIVAGSPFISRTKFKKLVELSENIGGIVVNGGINSDITSNFT